MVSASVSWKEFQGLGDQVSFMVFSVADIVSGPGSEEVSGSVFSSGAGGGGCHVTVG